MEIRTISAKRMAAGMAACVLLAALLALAGVQPAQAKSYTCNGISIDATAQEDASLKVSETRIYRFDGSFSLVGFVLVPPENGELVVNGVKAKGISPDKEITLDPVAFKKEWRDSGGPGSGYYSVDAANDTVYCFAGYSGECSVTVDYSYTNAVVVHKDVSELYWRFVGEKMEVDSNNVKLTVNLPVPKGEELIKGDNVRAWGHGALGGKVSFDGDAVVFDIFEVTSGEFAEARITYPASWTPKAAQAAMDNSSALDSILAEEERWAGEANTRRWQARLLIIVPLLLSLLLLIAAIAVFFRYGREYKPDFQGDYWRDVPEKGVGPALTGRIYRWGENSTNDFTATLMSLSARDIIHMEKVTEERARVLGLGTKTVDDYVLTKVGDGGDMTDLERRAYTTVFDIVGGRSDAVSFEQIKEFGKRQPESLVNAMDAWQGKLDAMVANAGVFEEQGERYSRLFKVASVALVAVVGVIAYSFLADFAPLIAVLPCSIATFVLAGKIRRRSKAAAEINARSEALKRWFKDFTNLKEALPTDTKVWGELLVYAYVLGVAKEAIENLRVRVPQLWEDDWFHYYSYWYWMPHGGPVFSNALGSAIGNTVSTAKAALSSDSDASGGGGGFSGGGGGGFGGGGGGFAR